MASPAASPLSVDSEEMWAAAVALPEQLAAAVDRSASLDLGSIATAAGPWSDVVVCGMGADGFAGDVLAAVASPRMAVPVSVVKSYHVPNHVGPRTLVFAVSCSGDTEETVAATGEARARGASVVTIAGPGDLARAADDAGEPVVPVPSGIREARAALGALAAPPLVVLERLGLLSGVTEGLRETAAGLARSRDSLIQRDSVAGQLARRIGTTVPLVAGTPGPTGVAALRWKTQINENAKAPAFVSLQPEAGHNELAGWGQHGDVTRQVVTLVPLRYRGEDPRIARRFDLTRALVDEVVANILEVRTDAATDIGALFDLCLLGDFVSLHLAASEGVDPGPVPVVRQLDRAMRAG